MPGLTPSSRKKALSALMQHLCEGTKTNMVVHYSVSTRHAGPDASNKVLVGHADETLVRGGMGVSSQVNMGSENEASMIERMGELNRQALHADLPSFGMVYARGRTLTTNPRTSPVRKRTPSVWPLSWVAMRQNAFGRATRLRFEPSPPAPRSSLLLAGGPATGDTLEVLTTVEQALHAGASGVCMGRQVFAHANPRDGEGTRHDGS